MPPFAFTPTDYPAKPGCYLMNDGKGRVIYVGKAKRLRTRLSSYFQPGQKNRKALRMIKNVADIEVIITDNEYESLVLENNLIKLYHPRYNRVLMADDSGYYYIEQTGEQYPRFLRFRKNRYVKALDGLHEVTSGTRFGPYIRAKHREIILEFVNDHFRIRTCKPLGHKVCLRYHLGRCSGICEGKLSNEEYAEHVRQAVRFLAHPQDALVAEMRHIMQEHAARLEFEKAQKVKTQVEALEQGLQHQIVETATQYDQDVLFFGDRHVLVAELRNGTLLRVNLLPLPVCAPAQTACLMFTLNQYAKTCPSELIVNNMANVDQLEKALATHRNHRVMVTVPKRGAKHELLGLCERNYLYRVKRLAGEERLQISNTLG